MSEKVRIPQFDRGAIESPVGFYSTLFRLMKIGEQHAIPAIVKGYDRATGIVTAQPIVTKVAEDTDGNDILIPHIEYKVHLARFAHGGYVIDAPVFNGDTGWIVAADRNCTSAIENNSTILESSQSEDDPKNKGYERPDDNSLGGYAWGFFIPDSWGNTELTDEGLVVKGPDISVVSGLSSIKLKDGAITAKCQGKTIDISDSAISLKSDDNKTVVMGDSSTTATFGSYKITMSDSGVVISSGSDTITLDGSGLHFNGTVDIKKTFVTDVRYNNTLHQLQKKTVLADIRGDFIVALGSETDWTKVDGGQAVPEEPCRCG